MDDINQLISPKIELEKLNTCGLHLQVLSISDITNNQESRLLYSDKIQTNKQTNKHGFYSLVVSPKYIV